MTRFVGRRTWTVGGLFLLLVVMAGLVANHRNRARTTPLLGPFGVTIVPGIHLLGGQELSAAYVIETSEGLVLVDSGLEANASLLKSQMAKLGLDWRRIRRILLTHVHGDHVGGAEHLRTATGAKVYAGRGDATVLRAGAPREAFFSTFYMPDHSPHPTTVDVELDGDEVIGLGDVRFRALAMPGHTPGSICYLLERGGLRALFAGDVVMQVGSSGSLGTYSAYLPPRYRGDAKSFLSSLRELRAMAVPDLVLPGHPVQDPAPQSPRLSQQLWESFLDAGINEMATLVARYETDGADFLDDQPKQLLPNLYYLGDVQGTAVYGLFACSRFFLVNAPGGPGLIDALKSRLQQLGVAPSAPTAVLLTSCDAEVTCGLKELVERSRAWVVAPPAGVERIKQLCPPGTIILPADDLPKQAWFKATPIPLRGRGVDPIAYSVSWAGKTVLLSGRIPSLFDHNAMERLYSDLSDSKENSIDFLTSINQLDTLNPELWLPAFPSDGQNANLYDGQWRQIISNNYRIGYSRLAHPAIPPRGS
jgi:glyoxylase-like metal-dependent hydrolase (beta-lactamase superfamily II)